MFKKIIILSFILVLTNCSAPTALLGPSLTVARTGNIYQAGLSYGSGQMIKKAKETLDKVKETKNVIYQRVDQLQERIEKEGFKKVVLKNQSDIFFKTVKNNLKKFN